MTGPLDLVTLQAAFEYLDLEPDGDELTRKVQSFITAASLMIDRQRGPIITRELVPVDAGNARRLDIGAAVTPSQRLALLDHCGHVSIGTAADPWATSVRARILSMDLDADELTTDQDVTVPADSALFTGRHLAADVPEDVRLACLITLRNRWQYEVATVSQTYDNPTGGTPYAIPMAARDLLADYPPVGLA